VELLKQPQYSPFPVERQVVSVWMGTEGYVDGVPVEDIRRFESEFEDELGRSNSGIYDAIRETGELSEDTIVALKDAIDQFRRTFEKSDGSLLVSEEPAEPLDAADVEAEGVKKYRQPEPTDSTDNQ
jgi:F-type H+-transporting ATPase subunit alpha